MTLNEIRDRLQTLETGNTDFSPIFVSLVVQLIEHIPVPADVSSKDKPMVLCSTHLTYKISPDTPDSGGFAVYQNTDGFLYVYFGKAGNSSDYVCPVLWDGEPCPYKKNLGGYRYVQDQHFHVKNMSLGEKLDAEDFWRVACRLDEYLEIETNPSVAIAKIEHRLDALVEAVEKVDTKVEKSLQRIGAVSKDLAKTDNEVKRIRRYIGTIWHDYCALVSTLQGVFGRKKWRKRFEKQARDFFEVVDRNDLYEEDDIPF